jgi:hypothetical protein
MLDLGFRVLAVQGCFCLHTAGTNAQTVAVYDIVLWLHVKSISGDLSYIVQRINVEHRPFLFRR